MNFKISPLYFLFGSLIGIGLFLGIIYSWPDGRLHIVFCDVGQGDAIYMRMPNGADILVDGGPNDRVLTCLGKHMPFYDRTIDVVAMTHPQKDHLQGLINVVKRYTVKYFVTVPVKNTTEAYDSLKTALEAKKIPIKYPTYPTEMSFGEVSLKTVWPQKQWLKENLKISQADSIKIQQGEVLGLSADLDLNLYSLYFHLQFKDFDLLLTGDGDQGVQKLLWQLGLSGLPKNIELLKVPHHGSKTGMTDEFIDWVRPKLSVIEVGKNSYGHPNLQTIQKLAKWGEVLRTDTRGDIEVITDGKAWSIN